MTRARRALALISTLLTSALALPPAFAADDPPSEDLAWTVGAWEGYRTDGEDGAREPMTLRVESILGGAGVTEHLEVGKGDAAYLGYSVTVYDPEAGAWVRQYVNAVRGRFVRLVGSVDGGQSTWEADPADRTEGARRSRLISERLADGRWRRTQQVSETDGVSWSTLWRDELRKVAVTRPELRTELLRLHDRDQALRRALFAEPDDEAIRRELQAFDQETTARAKDVLAVGGWPTVEEVGHEGSEALWLLIQHTPDPDFLAAALPAMKEAGERGDLGQDSVATTIDRVRVGRGEPQLYGTQFHEVDGEMVPYPIEDEARLAERRRKMHLIGFEEYQELLLETYRPAPEPTEPGGDGGEAQPPG